jgi:CRP-like cAMP-binding protein
MISPETLRRFSLFAELDAALVEDLAAAGEEVEFKRGEWLFNEGKAADTLYLILSGTAERRLNLDEAGTRQTSLSEVSEGDITGWSALVEPHLYTVGIVATETTKAVTLDAAKLHAMMEKESVVGYMVMAQLANELAERLTNLRIQLVSFFD